MSDEHKDEGVRSSAASALGRYRGEHVLEVDRPFPQFLAHLKPI